MTMMQHDNGYGSNDGNCYHAFSGGDNNSSNNTHADIVNVTIEEPDETSELMLQLEGESAPCPASVSPTYDNHDLFYHQYEYDPLLYFAEYNQNNPIQQMIGNNNGNENENDTDTLLMRESEEELQLCQGSFHHKNLMNNTSLSSLEPISESDTEEDEDAEEDAEEQECN